MKERILCAAIHYDDGKFYEGQPENIESGIIVSGWRHGNCFYTLFGLKGGIGKSADCKKITQGFLTSKNRYVNRKTAFKIAKTAGQVPTILKTGSLISEDLY